MEEEGEYDDDRACEGDEEKEAGKEYDEYYEEHGDGDTLLPSRPTCFHVSSSPCGLLPGTMRCGLSNGSARLARWPLGRASGDVAFLGLRTRRGRGLRRPAAASSVSWGKWACCKRGSCSGA